MANRAKFTPKKRQEFLTHLRLSGNVSYSASMCGMSRRGVYDAREADERFASDWDEALQVGIDALEQEARRRAFSGVKRVKITQRIDSNGATILSRDVTTEYSDTLMIFLLKAARPQKYRENIKIEHDVSKLDSDIERELAILSGSREAAATGEAPVSESIH